MAQGKGEIYHRMYRDMKNTDFSGWTNQFLDILVTQWGNFGILRALSYYQHEKLMKRLQQMQSSVIYFKR